METRKMKAMELEGEMVREFKKEFGIHRIFAPFRSEVKDLIEAFGLEEISSNGFVDWFRGKSFTEFQSRKGTWWYEIDLYPESEDALLIVFETKKKQDKWQLEKTLRAYTLLENGYNWRLFKKSFVGGN